MARFNLSAVAAFLLLAVLSSAMPVNMDSNAANQAGAPATPIDTAAAYNALKSASEPFNVQQQPQESAQKAAASAPSSSAPSPAGLLKKLPVVGGLVGNLPLVGGAGLPGGLPGGL